MKPDILDIKTDRVARIFKALCDEKRILIIRLLQSGSKCACNITESLGIAQSALSYHMKILCESGIVECWYVGKWTHYKISDEGATLAVDLLRSLTSLNTDTAEEDCACKRVV